MKMIILQGGGGNPYVVTGACCANALFWMWNMWSMMLCLYPCVQMWCVCGCTSEAAPWALALLCRARAVLRRPFPTPASRMIRWSKTIMRSVTIYTFFGWVLADGFMHLHELCSTCIYSSVNIYVCTICVHHHVCLILAHMCLHRHVLVMMCARYIHVLV